MPKTAKFLRRTPTQRSGQDRRLYELSEPVEFGSLAFKELSTVMVGLAKVTRMMAEVPTTTWVVVSAIEHAFDTHKPETYIFPSDENGKVLDWGELPGSYRGGMSHEKALIGLGFEVLP